jgi:NADH-quinone oxidoreductase subunit N
LNQEIINSIYYLLPELTLALSIIIITVYSSFSKKNISRYILLTGLTVTFTFLLFRLYAEPVILFSGLIAADHFASFCKLLIIFSALGLALVLNSKPWSSNHCILLILMALGAISSVSSANLVMTFISLEAINISLYILISAERKTSLKYYIYSAVSSGLLVYGITLLYGMTGSADYYEISRFFSSNPFNELTLTISVILIIAGLGFKLLLFPFSFIMPSISEHISLKKVTLVTIIPIIAGIAVICRLFLTIFHDTGSFSTDENLYSIIDTVKWQNMIAVISTSSILTGSLVILWQKNLKKIFIFLLIAQAGYLLLPLSIPSPEGLAAILLNLFAVTINFLGIATCFHILTERLIPADKTGLQLNDLKGLGKKSPFLFSCMIILLISTAGFPLTLGFTGKQFIYYSLFTGNLAWAGVAAVLSSAALFYFIFKLASLTFSGFSSIKITELETIQKFILLLLTSVIIFFGIYPAPILDLCRYSSQIFGI